MKNIGNENINANPIPQIKPMSILPLGLCIGVNKK
jgi:hypothetical protein